MIGLELCETLTGTLRLTADPSRERPVALTYRARTALLPAILRAFVLTIEGAIEADGLAAHGLLHGTVTLDPQGARALLPALCYALTFTADDGRLLRFTGRRALDLRHPRHALSLLPGAFLDERGDVIGRALLRLDLRTDLGRWIESIRLVRS